MNELPHSRSHRPVCGRRYLFTVSSSGLLYNNVIGTGFPRFRFHFQSEREHLHHVTLNFARLGRKVNFAAGKIPSGSKSPQKCIYSVPVQETADIQTSCKVLLASVERRRCSNETKTRNRLKFAGCPKRANRSQP